MMKRKQLTILLTTVTALSVCACGKTEEVTQVSEKVESVQTESTEIEQTENQTQTVKPDEEIVKTEAPTEAVIAEMLDHVLDWTGLQYFYKEDASIEHLGADEAIAMAAHAANQIQGGLEMDENYSLIIPQDVLDEMMVDYFGKTYEISEYTNPEYSMVQVTEDGTVLLQQGDWGLTAPQYEIQSIEPDESTQGAFLVSVDYYAYDYEEAKNLDIHYAVTYQYQPCEESQFGYCITDMQAAASENGTVSNPKNLTEQSMDGYTDEELCDFAGNYYAKHHDGFLPPIIEADGMTEAGMVMIHLYEIVDDHAATSDWYTVDRATGKGYDVNFNDVDLLEE